MMRFTRIVTAAAFVFGIGMGSGAALAQDLSNVQGPAELPPASYRGAQYVDSKGCVFIRAGIDGNVNWVPRVNRQRQLICGQTPTLSGAQRAIAPDPAPPATVASPAPAAPAPATRAAPQPRPVSRQVTTTAPRTATPVPVATRRPVAPPKPAPKVVRRASDVAIAKSTVSPQTRVVPRHVYDARTARTTFPVPKGYRPVWDDDRLNPRRAEQSLEGIARTRLIWTQTVPRRLVDQNTGKDVTSRVALVYPYTDATTQQRELGTVTLVQRDGQLFKRVVRNKSKPSAPSVAPRTKAIPAVQAAAAARYVQVGTYKQPANAQAAAHRIQRAGLPARIGKLNRGGKSYQVVLAGPFANGAPLAQGLRKSKVAGFRDAFIR